MTNQRKEALAVMEGKQKQQQMSKEQLTAEEILEKHWSCATYRTWGEKPERILHDDNCMKCEKEEEVLAAMQEYADHHTSTLSQQIDELREELDETKHDVEVFRNESLRLRLELGDEKGENAKLREENKRLKMFLTSISPIFEISEMQARELKLGIQSLLTEDGKTEEGRGE